MVEPPYDEGAWKPNQLVCVCSCSLPVHDDDREELLPSESIFGPDPPREGVVEFWTALWRCFIPAPCHWLALAFKFVFYAMPDLLVLGFSYDGDARMRAIESCMRRLGREVPHHSLEALQAGTDITARMLGYRLCQLTFRGKKLGAYDAKEAVGGGEWVWPAGLGGPDAVVQLAEEHRRLVFYIHGGAFVLCNPSTQRPITCGMAEVMGSLVLTVTYRRSPQNRFPAALDDVVRAYCTVVRFFPPSRVIVAGESAGGNLSVALCLKLHHLGLPMPAGLILISPWLDLFDLDGIDFYGTKDYLCPELVSGFARAYVDMNLATNELASPLYAENLSFLPNTLLIYGAAEVLAAQGAKFGKRLHEAGVSIETYIGADMVHGFPIFLDVAYGNLGAAGVVAMKLNLILLASVTFTIIIAFKILRHDVRAASIVFMILVVIVGASLYLRHIRAGLSRKLVRAVDTPAPFEAFDRIGVFAGRIWADPTLSPC